MTKLDDTETLLAKRIRAAAKAQGIGVEALRVKSGLGGSTFYDLLRGETPRTTKVIRKLREVGVEVPRDVLAA